MLSFWLMQGTFHLRQSELNSACRNEKTAASIYCQCILCMLRLQSTISFSFHIEHHNIRRRCWSPVYPQVEFYLFIFCSVNLFTCVFLPFLMAAECHGHWKCNPADRHWMKCTLSVVWCVRIHWSVVFILAQCQHWFHLPPHGLYRCSLEISLVALDEYSVASSGCSCRCWQLVLLGGLLP